MCGYLVPAGTTRECVEAPVWLGAESWRPREARRQRPWDAMREWGLRQVSGMTGPSRPQFPHWLSEVSNVRSTQSPSIPDPLFPSEIRSCASRALSLACFVTVNPRSPEGTICRETEDGHRAGTRPPCMSRQSQPSAPSCLAVCALAQGYDEPCCSLSCLSCCVLAQRTALGSHCLD